MNRVLTQDANRLCEEIQELDTKIEAVGDECPEGLRRSVADSLLHLLAAEDQETDVGVGEQTLPQPALDGPHGRQPKTATRVAARAPAKRTSTGTRNDARNGASA